MQSTPDAARPVICSVSDSFGGQAMTWRPGAVVTGAAKAMVGLRAPEPPSSSSSRNSAVPKSSLPCGNTTVPPARSASAANAATTRPGHLASRWSETMPSRSSERPAVTRATVAHGRCWFNSNSRIFAVTFSMPPSSWIDAQPKLPGSFPSSAKRAENQSLCVFSQPCSSSTARLTEGCSKCPTMTFRKMESCLGELDVPQPSV
mmetsp:Transcript_112685/g.318411  ORF Transcript_112685/g.318411 Transcript_112685/m.318411 type:complete len:204 (-) Transcript_112685:2068-2679(-)